MKNFEDKLPLIALPADACLSSREYKLFNILWHYQGVIVGYEQITRYVWDDVDAPAWHYSGWALNQIARRLRNKLHYTNIRIVTARGKGYRLTVIPKLCKL